MNILFVMKHRGNAGNTHAVANYMRVAPQARALGGDLRRRRSRSCRICSSPPMSEPSTASSTCSNPRSIASSRCRRWPCSARFPRRHRLIFDMDGMYNPVIELDGYDCNHRARPSATIGSSYYDTLADRVAKPTLAPPHNPRVQAHAFYGYDPALEFDPASARPSSTTSCTSVITGGGGRRSPAELLPAFEQIRDQVGEIGFVGLWWDQPPAEGPEAGPRRRSSRIPRRSAGCGSAREPP